MLKVVILTSSNYGTAAHHLPLLLESNVCEISMVIVSQGNVADKKKYHIRRIKKILKIGLLGALNGIRMRKWFTTDVSERIQIHNLKETCDKNNIPYYETPSINNARTRELLNLAKPHLGLSLGNGYIGEKIFSLPSFGMINIHHEILPEYKNAQSIIWQIYNMSSESGYTIHQIDKHIDNGKILHQEKVPIEFNATLKETISTTSVALLRASAKGLVYVISNFEDLNKNAQPQRQGNSYTTPSIVQFMRIYRNFKKLKNHKI